MYQYWAYGLKITSEFEFPELLPQSFAEEPDLTITLGKTPEALSGEDIVQKSNCSIGPDRYLLWLPVARYYVSAGNSILVEPAAGSDEKSVRLFLLSNAMAAVLHQRDDILLHASAVYVDDGVVLFCGHSGAGKSTIVASLEARGFPIFSDDVCVLKHDSTGAIRVVPSYPMMKLWADSFEKLEVAAPAAERSIRPGMDKYSRFLHDRYQTQPMQVLKIFLLEPSDTASEEITIRPLSPVAAFVHLQQQTYRNGQMNAMGKRNRHFELVSSLTAQVPVWEVVRRKGGNTVAQVAERVMAFFSDSNA